jgi:putative peptidoglycan lipid II flippase
MLPLGAFAMTAANAAFPTFAALAARGDSAALALTGRRSIGIVASAMAVALAATVALGADAIEVLFGRQAFGAESIRLTTSALVAYAAGLPAHGLLEVQMRLAFALKDTRTPVAIGVGAMAVNVAVAAALTPIIGHVGIGLGLSIAATIEAGLLGVVLEKRLPGVHDGLGALAARLCLVAVVAVGVGWGTGLALGPWGLPATVRLGVGGATFALAAGASSWIFRVAEVVDLADALTRWIRQALRPT